MQGTDEEAVRFEILGPLRAHRGPRELDLGPGKQRAVLATLLVAGNRPVPPGRIIEAVWRTDPPANGANVVQKYVAGLRRALEPDRAPRTSGQLLTLTDGGYLLAVAPGGSDAEEFTAQLRRAGRLRAEGRPEDAAGQLREALALWRAEPLMGLDGPVFDAARERLVESRAAALEDWAEIELELGRHAALLPELGRLVAEFPLRERLRAVQMLALYRSGRQAEALSVFREARRLLVGEYGVEPGQQLRQLHQRMLQTDPTLLPAPARPGRAVEAPPIDLPRPGPGSAPALVPVPVSPQLPGTRPWWRRGWFLKPLVAILPLATLGLASGPVMTVIAVSRRSRLLGLAAVGYFAAAITGFALVGEDPEALGAWDDIGMGLLLLQAAVSSVHAALLVPAPSEPTRGDTALAVRRDQARQVAELHPLLARELGIGRPDLGLDFDDGGLVDLNDAPAAALASLPGVSAQQAALIVADRAHRGQFRSAADLVDRGIVAAPLPAALADRILVVTVQDVVGGAGQNP